MGDIVIIIIILMIIRWIIMGISNIKEEIADDLFYEAEQEINNNMLVNCTVYTIDNYINENDTRKKIRKLILKIMIDKNIGSEAMISKDNLSLSLSKMTTKLYCKLETII
ncbi:MAG: hypothetical protein DRG78_23845 [Epsilonproteobacteria bacterium]|nr:MAG: hypothetical protein DRG78_23845 [Campylobacterota bacterium]